MLDVRLAGGLDVMVIVLPPPHRQHLAINRLWLEKPCPTAVALPHATYLRAATISARFFQYQMPHLACFLTPYKRPRPCKPLTLSKPLLICAPFTLHDSA
jgi:hypothetical protein